MPVYSTEIHRCNGRRRARFFKIAKERRQRDRERREKRQEGKFRMPKMYQTVLEYSHM